MSEQVYGPGSAASADQCFVGRKADAGKPRWSLLPWNALGAVVSVLEFGARKYAPGNWRHVPDARTLTEEWQQSVRERFARRSGAELRCVSSTRSTLPLP